MNPKERARDSKRVKKTDKELKASRQAAPGQVDIDHSKLLDLFDRVDKEELRTICFLLRIDYDNLRGEGKKSKARELIIRLENQGRLRELVEVGKREHPNIQWDDVLQTTKKVSPERPRKDYPSPPAPPHNFTGRDAELSALREVLTSSDTPQAIVGMRGVGKTALARQLADQIKDDFPGGVFWADLPANGGDPLAILADWAGLCGRGDYVRDFRTTKARAQAMRGVLDRWGREWGRLLVVLDDVQPDWLKGAQSLQDACPSGTALLLTTCDEELALVLNAVPYPLGVLPLYQALELLATDILAGRGVVEQEPEVARQLAEEVGRLPLALELVGKQAHKRARKQGWRLAELLKQVQDRLIEVKDGVIKDALQIKGQLGLTATFSLSYDALDSDQQRRLFRTLGIFAHAPFAVEHVAAVLGWEKQKTEDELDELVTLSLVQWEQDEKVAEKGRDGEEESTRYTLHSLLRDYAAAQLKVSGEYSATRSAYTDHYLTCARKHKDKYTVLETEHQNLVHTLKQFWERVEEEQATGQYIEMLNHLRGYLLDKGWWLDYRRHAEQAYTVACDLGAWRLAAQQSSEVVDAYSPEGWWDRGDLEVADSWVVKAEEAIDCFERRQNRVSEAAGDWVTSQEKRLDNRDANWWRAYVCRLRGKLAMRRYEYKESRLHFEDGLQLLDESASGSTAITKLLREHLYIFLAKLEMRYNNQDSVDDVRRYDTVLEHLRRALKNAEERGDEENQAVIKITMAELMIWWDEWDGAAQVLDEISTSKFTGRYELSAEHLALQAFVHQHKSKGASNYAKKLELLNTAIENAEESLRRLKRTPTSEYFIHFCDTYLLLAGLHRCRRNVVGCGNEDNRKFNDYLSGAWRLIDVRKTSRGDDVGEFSLDNPDACYERACYEVMAVEDLSASKVDICRLLSDAVLPQPGWYNRAKTDFRLETFQQDKRQWKIFDEMVKEGIKLSPDIIGGRED
ncbi:MAG: hypothetical protein B6I35_07185 [Anaerolineaceae bacterium 4572_32.2]|nr:MAG: hypothetical protein B6I35_07185 [Anaerolineaceae bacterium 4572_32.2]HEY72320.1 AAA family ATPase [Thermoflexia bacterium]